MCFFGHRSQYSFLALIGLIAASWDSANCGSKEWRSETGWTKESVSGIGKLNALDVICGKDHMTVRAEFNGPFQGIVFSKGTYGQDNCVYIKPYSGTTHATFKVNYDQCGTKPDLQGKYYENTIVIQYGTDIIEAWDEAKRLRCEWFEAYEKPATFRPAIPVADLDVVEMNFQGDDIDCWMEIQEGKGPWGREVSRIVPVGQPMTIVIAINDYNGQFDMRVKSCFAHDGIKPPIHLTDEHGCVLRQKMLTPFTKIRDSNGRATVISYSHFYAFKFPDSMNVQIQCTVEVCRHGCPDACQKGSYPPPVREIQSKITLGEISPRNPQLPTHNLKTQNYNKADEEPKPIYQDIGLTHQSSPIAIPGLPDGDIAKHTAQILQKHGVDVNNLQNAVYRNNNNNNGRHDESNANEQPIAEESKPVVKVLEIDLSHDQKRPIITEQDPSHMSKDDYNHATKMLSNLGLNVDFGNLAAGFIEGLNQKDIAQFLQNDQLREAMASGLKFPGGSEKVPEAQALVSKSNEEATVETQQPQIQAKSTESALEQNNSFNPNPESIRGQQLGNQTKIKEDQIHGTIRQNIRHTQQQHQQHSSQDVSRKQASPVRQTSPQTRTPQEIPQNPVVQVLNIPLKPGLPPVPMHQTISNFIHHQTQSHKLQRPSRFQLPRVRIPFIPGFEMLQRHEPNHQRDKHHDMPMRMGEGIPLSLPAFPHGPRSLRLRRSSKSGPEISVTKQFQVVTSIDLSFSPNLTTDHEQIYEGRREGVVYGVCMPVTGLIAGLGALLMLISFALISSICMMQRMNKLKDKKAGAHR